MHLVSVYDQTNMSAYLNGRLVASTVACAAPPCGPIVYPAPSSMVRQSQRQRPVIQSTRRRPIVCLPGAIYVPDMGW